MFSRLIFIFRLYNFYFNFFVTGTVVRKSKSRQSYEVSKKCDEGKILFYTLPQCCVLILMSGFLFFTESNDPSISKVRKQVLRNVRKNVINHSDVEVVDHIPDDPQDNDKEESSEVEDQDKLIDAGNLQESSDKYVDLDDDSDDSADEEKFYVEDYHGYHLSKGQYC